MGIIECCAQQGHWEQAYAAWTQVQVAGLQLDTACLTALLTTLLAARQWQHMVQVFQAARLAQVAIATVAQNSFRFMFDTRQAG